MTQSTPPSWLPDPEDSTRQRWWDGYRWTDQTRTPRKRSWKPWAIGAGVLVVALGAYIGISAATGFQTYNGDEKTAAPTHTASLVEKRSDTNAVLGAASKLCADAVRRHYADPQATFTPDGWTITATNPAGKSQPSWRVQGVTDQRGSMRTPLQFLCDVEWLPATDEYQATLV